MSERFMISDSIFDGMELDADGAFSDRITEKTDIDGERVRSLTFLRLGLSEKNRRSGRTAKRIFMIAAAAAVVIIMVTKKKK